MELVYKIKMLASFKDGNILGGRFIQTNEFLNVSESDAVKIRNSGGEYEIVETLIPNPLKKASPEVVEVLAEQQRAEEAEEKAKEGELLQAAETITRPVVDKPESEEKMAAKQVNKLKTKKAK